MAKTKEQKFDVTMRESDGILKLTLNSKRVRKYFTEQYKKNDIEVETELTEVEFMAEGKNSLIAVLISHNFCTEIV